MIELHRLQKTIDQRNIITIDQLTVTPGEVAAIVGPVDGSREELLRLLTGQPRPTVGRISVAGVEPHADHELLAQQVGVLFAEHSLYMRRSPLANLRFTCRLYGLPGTRADEVLALVGLADQAGARLSGFSPGMLRRLALAGILCRMDLAAGLEFIAFGDHEYYAYSDITYVEEHGARMPEIIAAINMDGIGQRLGSNNITLMTASQEFRAALEGVVAGCPGVVWTDPWPQSNHATFAWRGVPSIAFSTDGMKTVHHQPCDTTAWISEAKVREVVTLVTDIVEAIHTRPPTWTREPA